MTNTATSDALPSDMLTVLAPPTPGEWAVIVGRSEPGQQVPFVCVLARSPRNVPVKVLATEGQRVQVHTRPGRSTVSAGRSATCQWSELLMPRLRPDWGARWALDDRRPDDPRRPDRRTIMVVHAGHSVRDMTI